MQHLATGEGLHGSDTKALKRAKPQGLRHGVPKGRRVIIVYDKAGIDLPFWKRCRQECAVYFLSMVNQQWIKCTSKYASGRLHEADNLGKELRLDAGFRWN